MERGRKGEKRAGRLKEWKKGRREEGKK